MVVLTLVGVLGIGGILVAVADHYHLSDDGSIFPWAEDMAAGFPGGLLAVSIAVIIAAMLATRLVNYGGDRLRFGTHA